MLLIHALTLSLLSAGPRARADESIPYVPMTVCEAAPFASIRDYWDHTGTFCFETDHRQHLWKIADMGEIILRHDGRWLPGPFVDALSADNREIVAAYPHYAVRYLALGDEVGDGSRSFVTQVFYGVAHATLTTYVFGEISPRGHVRLTGFSDAGHVDPRTWTKTLKNAFAIFRNKDPNRIAVDEMKRRERRRIQPVINVIGHERAGRPAFE